MQMNDLVLKLRILRYNFENIIEEVKHMNGKIPTEVLNEIDYINKLSVEV